MMCPPCIHPRLFRLLEGKGERERGRETREKPGRLSL
jgi:hypothetical protein